MMKLLPLGLILGLYLITPKTVNAQTNHLPPISHQIVVSAAIGEAKLTIYGFAPSDSTVKLIGIGLTETTTAQADGYYQFINVYLPTAISTNGSEKTFSYPELCLYALDDSGLTTSPTCIPPLPTGSGSYLIGPVNLSPTLQLEKGLAYENQTVKASGRTTPETDITVYLAESTNQLKLVKEVSAFYIPIYHIRSDNQGYYEFSLPTESANSWRVFTASLIDGENSPKSNSLNFKVNSFLYLLIEIFTALFNTLRPYLFLLIVALEIIIVLLLINHLRRNNYYQKAERPAQLN